MTFRAKADILGEIYAKEEEEDILLKRFKIENINKIDKEDFKIVIGFEVDPVRVVKVKEVKYRYEQEET